MSNERRLEFLLMMINKVPEQTKIKFFQEIGFSGRLNNLKSILPVDRYDEEKVRMAARAASLKIMLRAFEDDEETHSLDIDVFREVLEKLERNYDSLAEDDLADPEMIREMLQRAAGMKVVKTIPIEVARPGIVLAKPVRTAAGVMLAGEGTELDAEMIERLKQQEVYWMNVGLGPETFIEIPPVIGEPDQRTDEIKAELDHRFGGLENNRSMNNLKEAALRFLINDKVTVAQ
ncbi:MAG: hypothetical protein JW902_06760 [Syntrophaceae bacterium]|nr:hypothetical protein [Syntrophaceae bacterium]